ncbi:MAG: DUF2189 domain-containing protein [Rhodospirillaceae bacterium]|nr:DUF2189 domain-containing protein [Rhodospirillaceae bacterium]MBT6087076.1 DUF2189 domain-containing protein [Rhodospirillaceae bacterium]MBT6609443.1 DUF2189 domain-containing protein [Rhodospirillaceae bacterium]
MDKASGAPAAATVSTDAGAAPAARYKTPIQVNVVAVDDLLDVLALALRDFRAAPVYGIFFSGIYVVGGWALIALLLLFDLPYLIYPLAASFALIAPFIASGFYVVSRQLENEQAMRPGMGPDTGPDMGKPDLSWTLVFATVKSMFDRDLGWMALVTGFSWFIWLDIAAFLTFGFMGFQIFGFEELIDVIFTTPSGWLFLVVGNAVGAIIAFAVFSYSVVSIPMLFDRDIDFVTAMLTSVRFVTANPRVMAVWCAIIAATVAVSLLSGLVALFVTLPVLGHATWHLYRRAVPPPQ